MGGQPLCSSADQEESTCLDLLAEEAGQLKSSYEEEATLQ